MITDLEEFDYANLEYSTLDKPITAKRIAEDLIKAYNFFCKELILLKIFLSVDQLKQIADLISTDLKARVDQDPIALSEEFIYSLSRSFKVIFYYRLANHIFYLNDGKDPKNISRYCAFRISEFATRTTCIEIHPEARIGKSFVIDHGINTLIGATTIIGNNCTILQNVVLGSRKITFNEKVKRHPTIGDNVHISGGVRIFGSINIGNNVIIGPDCLIDKDVLDDSIIKLHRRHTISFKKKVNG